MFLMHRWTQVASILTVALIADVAAAQTILRVDGQDGLTLQQGATGTTWPLAYRYLSDALAAIVNPSESNPFQIWVLGRAAPDPPVTYYPDENSNSPSGTDARTDTFSLRNDVRIYGGFAGNEDELEDRDFLVNVTILSGNINNTSIDTDNSYHVVRATGSALTPILSTAVLDGFTIRDGRADGEHPPGGTPPCDSSVYENGGGGLYNWYNASPAVRNCVFEDNYAQGGGGAVRNRISWSPLFVNCTFRHNRSDGNGGGMFCQCNSTPKLINCQFLGNSCPHVGGGFSSRDNSIGTATTFVNCSFVGNHADDAGGGMRIGADSQAKLINCTFTANNVGPPTAYSPAGGGGIAIGNDGQGVGFAIRQTELINCVVWDNSAQGTAQGPNLSINGTYQGIMSVAHTDSQGGESAVYIAGIPPDPPA